ncbi:MAG: N-acetylmannosamine-6-phosphate 2-epimerase [Bacillota bacterium]|nr:N-acetylmannosamine-6-phosphate 2-epimerase [Bacillota bacterium]
MKKIEQIKGNLIVSCQALPEEPLHSSFIMGRMALAAFQGGAQGIRANSVEDILEIRKNVDLPIIGIIKKVYDNSSVYITPTIEEVKELVEKAQPDIVALDATCRIRPDGKTIDTLYLEIRKLYPEQLLMADCSTIEEMLHADALGFDYIGTTLVGYTKESEGDHIEENDFQTIQEALSQISHPIIAEGNIDTPEKVRRVLELGCHSVVVGSIITRPQIITKRFVDAIKK